RIEQALFMADIKHALGRHQLEHMYVFVEGPAMRRGAGAKLFFSLRQSYVETPLAGLRAFEKEVERNCGLAGAGCAFEQEHMAGSKAPAQDFVEASNACRSQHRSPFGIL